MAPTSFASRLRARDSLLGTFAFLPSEDAAEAMARSGLDFVVIDMEHSPKDWRTVSNMIRGVDVAGCTALVRVQEISELEILHALDVGASGVVLPFVDSPQDVVRAVRSGRYPPHGDRGVCTMTRAVQYGVVRDRFSDIAAGLNERVVFIGQIESATAAANIEEILDARPGLDAVIVGRADLATSIGLPGQSGHPQVEELTRSIFERVRRHGSTPFGLAVYSPEESIRWAELGATIFVYSADVSVLTSAYARACDTFRSGSSAARTAQN